MSSPVIAHYLQLKNSPKRTRVKRSRKLTEREGLLPVMSFFPRRVEKSLTWLQWQHNMHIAVLEVEFSSRSQEELFLLSLLDWRIYWRKRWRKAGRKRKRNNCQARWPSCNQFSDFFNFFVKQLS